MAIDRWRPTASGDRMTGYDPAKWVSLFQSAAATSGALAGLIFIALNTNIDRLIEFDKKTTRRPMTGRARESLLGLLSILVVCVVALTPGIRNWVLAAFIVLTAVASAVSPVIGGLRYARQDWRRVVALQRLVSAFVFSLCLLTCGVTLLIGYGGGLLWLPVCYVLAIVQASLNSWSLSVEARRGMVEKPVRERPIIGAEIPSRPKRNRGG
jgi:hypothetical protein